MLRFTRTHHPTEAVMNDPVINSLPDLLLFVVPCIGLLIFTMFRLDEQFSAPRHGSSPRPMCGLDVHGEPILCDPDGRRVPPLMRRSPLMRRRAHP